MNEVKSVGEALSLVTALSTLAGWFASILPPIAALASLMWIGFQFYHSAPIKEWRASRKLRNET